MRIRLLTSALLVAAVAGAFALPGFTEDEPVAGQGADSAWAELAKRGENHAWLGFMAGSWNAAAKFWMGPGDPQTSTGRMENQWIMGRRFMRGSYAGEWDGNHFQGEVTLGYDNATQTYQSAWIDTMSTGVVTATGTREGDVVTLTGTATMPMLGEVSYRTVYAKASADKYTMTEYWNIPEQGEMKVMEILYTRSTD